MAIALCAAETEHMRRYTLLAVLVGVLALASTAGSAKADLLPGLLGGNCGTTAPVFAPWGDFSGYYFAKNGGFESGSTGWSLAGGAQVVSGGDGLGLSGSGSHSLRVPDGGSASISTCYGLTYPAIRFTVSGPATVHVKVVAHSLLGVLSVIDGGTFRVDGSWTPSPKLSSLGSALAAPLGTKSVSLEISVEDGTAQIDDLFVDPFIFRS
jgi:hypothetical protein